MSLQSCNKICVNIEQNFSTQEQATARHNIGIDTPFAGQVVWYQDTHTASATEAANRVVSIQFPAISTVLSNTTGKSFTAEAIIRVTDTTAGGFNISGTNAVNLDLYRGSSSRVGNTLCIMSDLGGNYVPTLTGTIPFSFSSFDVANTFRLDMYFSPDLISSGTSLSVTVYLRYVQIF